MAPSRPPYATDEPDTFYETPAPQRRIRQKPAPDPNNRTSAYDVYDNYLSAGGNAAKRQSGTGALGMGLLSMGNDDDDDSDDEHDRRLSLSGSSPSKHAALAAATSTSPLRIPQNASKPKPIVAPQPGYAAPVSALRLPPSPSPPHPQARMVAMPKPTHAGPGPALPNPFADPARAIRAPPTPPSPTSPHPLQPPMTPITPVFARPAKAEITFAPFSNPATPRHIMRGNNEETLLPTRGEKGDDFWRRFSMVAKQPEAMKESSWLRRTRSNASQLSRWVWVTGIILLLCIGGAIGLAWYLTHNNPGHQQPTVIGGGDNNAATAASAGPSLRVSGSSTATIVKVTPTFTLANRAAQTETPPAASAAGPTRHKAANKRRKFLA